MKYVAITFDDGREDNYSIAFPIMDQRGLKGTVYATTGFVDGTWENSDVLQSPSEALSFGQIRELLDAGWEIGIHGDKHITEIGDCIVAYRKLCEWLNKEQPFGFSVPNSRADEKMINDMWQNLAHCKLSYIRKGRRYQPKGLLLKALYVSYALPGFQWAYNLFNKKNVFRIGEDELYAVPSVVVKSRDSAQRILRFVDSVPDHTVVVLMLHSILPNAQSREVSNAWVWSEEEFSKLCDGLQKRVTDKKLCVKPLSEIMAAIE